MIKSRKIFFISLIIVFLFFGAKLFPDIVIAEERDIILIAAASNLKFAMDDIIQVFEKINEGIKIKTIYGSSGNFFNQILNGAPFDLFFSADARYPKELKKRRLGNEITAYAFGRLVLMSPVDSDFKVQALGIKSLFHPSVKKIAIANPTHSPYGKAAMAFLKGQNIYEKIKEKLVMGENISQAAQFIDSGAAELGIAALSIAIKAREFGRVSYWEIPVETYPPIKQEFIMLRRSKSQRLVKDFTEFLKSRRGESILVKYGFGLPKSIQ